jgi:hypothetical protein
MTVTAKSLKTKGTWNFLEMPIGERPRALRFQCVTKFEVSS